MTKTWIKTTVSTECDVNIEIYPNEVWDGIGVELQELDGSIRGIMYFNKDELKVFIEQMQNMMDYVSEE